MEAFENGDPAIGLFKYGTRENLAMNPDGEEQTAGKIVWKYNGRLEMSTRRSIRNSLEDTRDRAENKVSSRGVKGKGRKGRLQDPPKKVNRNLDVTLLSAALRRVLASGGSLFVF